LVENARHTTLGVISFGLALGVTFGVLVFFLGIAAATMGWGILIARSLSSLFIGFSPTFIGSITGAVWASVFGFAMGVMIAWLYNRFLLRRKTHLN